MQQGGCRDSLICQDQGEITLQTHPRDAQDISSCVLCQDMGSGNGTQQLTMPLKVWSHPCIGLEVQP
jgi:hypothetical protein